MRYPTTRLLRALLASVIALFAAAQLAAAAPTSAPPQSFGGGTVVIPGAPGAGQGEAVTISSQVWARPVTPGESVVVAIILNHAPGYHTWPAAEQNVLPKTIDDFAIRTAIILSAPPAWAGVRAVQWPELHNNPVPDLDRPGMTIEVPTFSGRAVAYATIDIAPDAPTGEQTLDLKVSWQACDDQQCLMPDDTVEKVTFTVASRPANFAAWQPPANAPTLGNDPITPDRTTPDVVTAPDGAPQNPTAVQAQSPSIFGFQLSASSGAAALIVLFLASAVGGFVLNLMPCVLPVIPIKILTLTKHAGSRRRAMILGAWTAFGVVFFWTALGVPVALFSEAIGDPSRALFGNWWVALGIGVLLIMLGVGSMGIFQFKLPQGAYMLNPDPNRPWGSFLFGIMTALLGLPCFGFAAGGLLAGMAVMPTIAIITVFVGIGVGMAVPYFVLSAFPQLLKKLPKAGPASDLIKQVMGMLLLAAAAFFVSVGFFQLSADHPWITTNIKWIVPAVFVTAAAAWLLIRTFRVAKQPISIAFGVVIALALAAASIWVAADFTSNAHAEWRKTAALAEDEIVTDAWLEYTPERLATARAQGKVIVIDFTAEWCINCKAYKRAVLDSATVKDRLARGDVVTFEGDVTSKASPAQSLMDQWNQTGIPLLVVLGPEDGAAPVFSNSAPASAVVDMIDRAGAAPGLAATASRASDARSSTTASEVAESR